MDGKVGISGKDGKDAVSISGKDGVGTIGLNGKDGATAEITVEKAKPNLDNADPINGKNDRIVYKDSTGTPQQVATMNDGMRYAGDNGQEPADANNVIKKKLNETVDILGGADKTKLSDNNIGVNSNGGKLYVKLSKELKDLMNAEFKNGTGPTTVINHAGITITPTTPKPNNPVVSLTENGLNNGGNKITNVAEGTEPNDAVNVSQLNKQTAASKTEVTANGGQSANATQGNINLTSTTAKDGHTIYDVKLADKVTLGTDPEKQITIDGTTGNIQAGKVNIDGANGTVTGLTNTDWDPKNPTPVTGRAATEDQLKKVNDHLNNEIKNVNDTIDNLGWNVTSGTEGSGKQTGTEAVEKVGDKQTVTLKAGNNLEVKQAGKDFTFALQKDVKGLDSIQVGSNGTDGKPGVGINGKDGSIGLTGKPGADGKSATATMTVGKGANGLDGTDGFNGKDGKTRIVYEIPNPNGGAPVKEEVATLNDGLKFKGDNDKIVSKKLNQQLDIIGGADKAKLTDNNIGVNANDKGQLEVKLAKDLSNLNSATFNHPNGGKTSIEGNGITITPANSTTNNSTISLTDKGLNNGGNQITNVAPGTKDGDAVNVSQLKQVQQNVGDALNSHATAINELGGKVNSGLANAAAMSMLEFQEIGINQTVVAAGVGTFNGHQAVAVGLETAPTENVRVNVKASVAPRTNRGINTMAGIGASYRFNWK